MFSALRFSERFGVEKSLENDPPETLKSAFPVRLFAKNEDFVISRKSPNEAPKGASREPKMEPESASRAAPEA